MSLMRDCGAVKCGESGVPTAFDVYYFRVKGRRVKLCVEDYGDVTLWGPKKIIAELSKRMADKVARAEDGDRRADSATEAVRPPVER